MGSDGTYVVEFEIVCNCLFKQINEFSIHQLFVVFSLFSAVFIKGPTATAPGITDYALETGGYVV